MFSSKTRRGLAALIAIAGLLAISVGTASAGAGVGPAGDMRFGPGGVGSEDDSYWGWNPLHPWQHNVVVIDANRGSNRHNDDGLDWFDPKLANPSLEDYANGYKPYLVDLIISIGPDGYGYGSPITGEGMGADNEHESFYGDIAVGLESAGNFCNRSYWTPCDIVLITYQAPESLDHQRHAMAEAMKLAADGHSLHTVAIGDLTATGAEILADGHYNFSALLGANGYHGLTDVHGAADTIGFIVEQRFRQLDSDEPVPWPANTPNDCWDVEYDWCEVEAECEVYDPDGYCYYGENDDEPYGNHVAIGITANYVDQTNWIDLVVAVGNAEITDVRYAVSDQPIDCDDATPTPEVAPSGILVDTDDIGRHYCLRVEFADGDVQFLEHQLSVWDIDRFEDIEEEMDPPSSTTKEVSGGNV